VSTCNQCRHWGSHVASAIRDESGHGRGIVLAMCLCPDSPLCRDYTRPYAGCRQFAPDLRPYPKEAA